MSTVVVTPTPRIYIQASEYTLFEHPTRGPIAIIGPFFMGAYFYAPVEVLPAPSREATHARRNARRNSSY
eukprot:1348821-Amorphochlora_amoeboformis.AAC.1